MRVSFFGGRGWAAVLGLFALAGCTVRRSTNAQCQFNSDCADPLVCGNGACRAACQVDRDCPGTPAYCVDGQIAGTRICVSSGFAAACGATNPCAQGRVCSAEGICVPTCSADTDCSALHPDSYCALAGQCALPGVGNEMHLSDGGPPDACSGASCALAPRPLAPLSTATVSSASPTLRWQLPAGLTGAHVELCADRACTRPLGSFDATGSSGAPSAPLHAGVVFWRMRGLSASGTGTAVGPTWQFIVGARSAARDASWGTALDLNGDGFADLAVGAPGTAATPGRVFLYYGSATGLSATASGSLTGPDGAGGGFGAAVASAGDLDGDGFVELVVGAPSAGSAGRAYVYPGSANGPVTTLARPLTGVDAGGLFGAAVASAGDMDGDGYAELAIGAPPGTASAGRVHVYHGSAAGLRDTGSGTLVGLAAGDGFGSSLAGPGDLDGDGFADLVVGAPGGMSLPGRAYVFRGNATALSAVPAVTLVAPDGAATFFGYAMAGAGDVNGDGMPELAVGAFGATPTGVSGRVHLYSGSASGPSTTPAWSLSARDGVDYAFGFAVAGAGDVDGDGFADLVVGAPPSSSTILAGRAYLYLGSASGPVESTVNTLTGSGLGDRFGASVSGLGDVDNDGYAELAVGGPGYNGAGRVVWYRGGATPTARTPAAIESVDGVGGQYGGSVARAGERNLPVRTRPRVTARAGLRASR